MSQPSTKLPADGPPQRYSNSNVANNQLDTAIAHRGEHIRMLKQQREQSTVLNQARPVLAALPLPHPPPRGPPSRDRKDGKKIQSVPPPPKGPPPRGPLKENYPTNRLHASLSDQNPPSRSSAALPVRQLQQKQCKNSLVLNQANLLHPPPPVAPCPPPRGPSENRRCDPFLTAPKQPVLTIHNGPPPGGPLKENYPTNRRHASISGENPSSRSSAALPVRQLQQKQCENSLVLNQANLLHPPPAVAPCPSARGPSENRRCDPFLTAPKQPVLTIHNGPPPGGPLKENYSANRRNASISGEKPPSRSSAALPVAPCPPPRGPSENRRCDPFLTAPKQPVLTIHNGPPPGGPLKENDSANRRNASISGEKPPSRSSAALPVAPCPPPRGPSENRRCDPFLTAPKQPVLTIHNGPPPGGPLKENDSANRRHASISGETPPSRSSAALPVAPCPPPRGPSENRRCDPFLTAPKQPVLTIHNGPPPSGPRKENYPANGRHASISGENPSSRSSAALPVRQLQQKQCENSLVLNQANLLHPPPAVAPCPSARGPSENRRCDPFLTAPKQPVLTIHNGPPPGGPLKENDSANRRHASLSDQKPPSHSCSAIHASESSANEAATTVEPTSSPTAVASNAEKIKTAPRCPPKKPNFVPLFLGLFFNLIKAILWLTFAYFVMETVLALYEENEISKRNNEVCKLPFLLDKEPILLMDAR